MLNEHGYISNQGIKVRLEGQIINDSGKLFEYVWVLDQEQ